MKIFICSACVFLSSCGVYNSSFDCAPGRGIGCASVSEVLNLIVERDVGEDIFVTDLGSALILRESKE